MHSSRDIRMRHFRLFTAILPALWLGGCMMQSQSRPEEHRAFELRCGADDDGDT